MALPVGTAQYYDGFKSLVASDSFGNSPAAKSLQITKGLSKPAQMSFFEKIRDWFRGGEKSNAYAAKVASKAEELVFKICIARPELGLVADSHQTTMSSFLELRDMAKDRYRDEFKFDYQIVKGQDENGHETSSISYQLTVADTGLMSTTIDGVDRESVLAFNKALVDTGIVPSALSAPPQSVGHADAMLLKALENALPKSIFPDAALSLASVVVQMDGVNSDLRYADAPHAAVGEKVRILSEAFPSQVFSIDFQGDRDHYAVTMRTPGDKAEFTLQQAEIEPHPADQAQLPRLLSSAIKQSVTNQMAEFGATLNDRDSFILGNAQTMCELPVDQAKLMTEMKNPDYSSVTFTGITRNPNNGTFTAMFGDQPMVFSNRSLSSTELRGRVLEERLSAPFANLEVIMSENHGTAKDSQLRYVLNTTRQNYFSQVDMDDKERADVHREIGDVVVGKTTLREIWNLPPPAQRMASYDEMADDVVPSRPLLLPTPSQMIDPHFLA